MAYRKQYRASAKPTWAANIHISAGRNLPARHWAHKCRLNNPGPFFPPSGAARRLADLDAGSCGSGG